MNDTTLTHRGQVTGALHVHLSAHGRSAALAPRVALLGTGKMGSAIAARLARAGFELTVWNRTDREPRPCASGRSPTRRPRPAGMPMS